MFSAVSEGFFWLRTIFRITFFCVCVCVLFTDKVFMSYFQTGTRHSYMYKRHAAVGRHRRLMKQMDGLQTEIRVR